MLQMVSFDIALNHYGPKAVQMLLIVSLRIILDYFGPRAAQMLEVISSGAILDQFGCPKKSTYFKWPALVLSGFNIVDQIHPNPFESIKIQPDPPRFGSAFSRLCEHMAQLSIRKSHPFGTAFPFERLSYGRNGLPFVNTFQSKRGSIRNGFGITPRGPVGPSPPRGPKAPFGTLGHPGVPLGPLGSTPRDRHLVEATERRLESLVAERLYRREDTGSAACA